MVLTSGNQVQRRVRGPQRYWRLWPATTTGRQLKCLVEHATYISPLVRSWPSFASATSSPAPSTTSGSRCGGIRSCRRELRAFLGLMPLAFFSHFEVFFFSAALQGSAGTGQLLKGDGPYERAPCLPIGRADSDLRQSVISQEAFGR